VRLLYRADGGHPIGTGHLFRAVRILRALRDRAPVEAALVFTADSGARSIPRQAPARLIELPRRLDPSSIKPRFDFDSVRGILAAQDFDLAVVDMLDTDAAEMAALAARLPVVTLDDRGDGRRHASAIVNILITEPDPGSLPPGLLLREGGAYAVLAPEISAAHRAWREPADVPGTRLFVTLGGADAAGLTVKVARALGASRHARMVEFGVGPAFPHRAELERALEQAPWESRVHARLPSLLERFLACDAAVVAGGLTMWEVCCLGVPAVAVCQPIDHQLELAERLAAAGAMATVGFGPEASDERIVEAVDRLLEDDALRRRLSAQGPRLVDGMGARRVADLLIQTASA